MKGERWKMEDGRWKTEDGRKGKSKDMDVVSQHEISSDLVCFFDYILIYTKSNTNSHMETRERERGREE